MPGNVVWDGSFGKFPKRHQFLVPDCERGPFTFAYCAGQPPNSLDGRTLISYPKEDTGFSMRLAKSFTIEADINEYVDETKGDRSASDRVNELLRRAVIQEQYARLEAEAAEFFGDKKTNRAEARAFQKASLRTFGRD
jgi:hypothetical protein